MEHSFENLKPLIRCPVCQKKYEPGKVLLLEEDEKKTTLHLTCEACHVSALIFVSLSAMGAVSFGILTDLEQSEAKRFYGSEAISSDDALSVHAFLKGFDGGLNDYLGTRS
jgi:hypothetical protein